MVRNLTPNEIYNFIVSDFEGVWDSVAANPNPKIGRGNFIFARQAMNLLEFAAMLYGKDVKIRDNFSNELKNIEPKYFTRLPSPCAVTTDFILPHIGDTSRTLLWALFDLIRHGLAHQYQQIVVVLMDRKQFYISLAIGADCGRYLSATQGLRPLRHLAYRFDSDGDLELILYPDTLFLDIKNAIDNSALLKQGLSFPYLSRPLVRSTRSSSKGPKIKYYDFGLNSLESSLRTGNHMKI